MLKIFSNPKKALAIFLLCSLVVLIGVLTWIPLLFDIKNINVDKWITNTLISVGIMISAIILGEIVGEERLKEKTDGLYQINLKGYNDILRRLKDEIKILIYFSQFFTWFKARELKQKKEDYLVDHGFDQLVAHSIITHITRDDIEQMRGGAFVKIDEKTGKELKFCRIHDDEYEVLKTVYSPDFTIDAPKYTYYLSAFGDSSSVSTLEQAKRLEYKARLNKTFNRAFKIALSIFVSFIWGMATVEEFKKGGVNEAIINTVVRIISLVSGLLGGYLTSVTDIKIASQKLENKAQVLSFFETHYENKEFNPKTYEELVEEELKKEEEEKANVVTPEVVSEEDNTPKLDVAVTPLPYVVE